MPLYRFSSQISRYLLKFHWFFKISKSIILQLCISCDLLFCPQLRCKSVSCGNITWLARLQVTPPARGHHNGQPGTAARWRSPAQPVPSGAYCWYHQWKYFIHYKNIILIHLVKLYRKQTSSIFAWQWKIFVSTWKIFESKKKYLNQRKHILISEKSFHPICDCGVMVSRTGWRLRCTRWGCSGGTVCWTPPSRRCSGGWGGWWADTPSSSSWCPWSPPPSSPPASFR